jgi:hypothetical protein
MKQHMAKIFGRTKCESQNSDVPLLGLSLGDSKDDFPVDKTTLPIMGQVGLLYS